MKKHIVCLFISLICLGIAKAQDFVVMGTIKPAILTPEIYKLFAKDSCKLIYHSLEKGGKRDYEIIDKINCENVEWYRVYYYGYPDYYVKCSSFIQTDEVDSLLEVQKKIYPDIKDRLEMAESLIEIPKEVQQKRMDSLQKSIDNSMAVFRSKNLVIWDWSWNYLNEYSSFASVKIEVINPYRQKIKYIWFTFRGYNSVDDPVRDGLSGKTDKTVKGIGPIEYNENGTYEFESVIYSKVIETMKLVQVKIQFFDGSVKLISNPKSLGGWSK